MKELEAELVVRELVAGGSGIATIEIGGERRAVFVEGVAPGDRVRASIDPSKRPARGRVLALLEGGPSRVEAPCAFADRCGGCDLMHVSAEARAAFHVGLAREALRSFPGGDGIEISHRGAAEPLRYRVRARVHVVAKGGKALVGMFAPRTNDPVVVDTCVALRPELDRALARLPELFAGARGKGEISLALGDPRVAPRPVVLDLSFSGPLPRETYATLERWVKDGVVAGARVTERGVNAPSSVGAPGPFLSGPDGEPLALAPGGFSQASEEGNRTLVARVDALAALATEGRATPRVVELYAGAGNLTVLLARRFDKLQAVEGDGAACEAARRNLASRGLTAKVTHADAAAFPLPSRADLVVLDPPRTGARDLTAALLAARPRAIVFVSCDPATLARDLGGLARSYEPIAAEVLDLFPQTSHTETLVALRERRPEKGA